MLVSVREVRIWQVVDVVLRAHRPRLRPLADHDGGRRRRRARLRRRAARRRRPHLLLLARHRDGRVLGREHVARGRALRRRLPDRPLAGRHLPGLAALQRHVPRADRLRGHRAGRGAHLAARLGDARSRRSVSRSSFFAFTRWFWRFGLRATPALGCHAPPRVPDRSLADRHLPRLARYSVTFLVPIAFAVTVPAEALTRGSTGDAGARDRLRVVFFAFTRWFWRFGLSRYSGASA